MNSPADQPKPSTSYVPALDGIRGVAILLVLLFHSGLIILGSGEAGHAYEVIARSSWCGVDLFFVLSGFLITGILLDARASSHYFRNFYARRVLRIFPLYYGVILWLFLQNPEFPNQIWYWLYLQNWGPLFGGETPPMVVQPFWSLAIEEQFYLFWPFLIYFLNRRVIGWVCGALFLLSLVARCIAKVQGVDPMTIYTVTFFRLDTLSAGALIAVWIRNDVQHVRLSRIASPALLGFFAAWCAVLFWDGGFYIDGPASQTVGYSLFAILSALLIFLVLEKESRLRPLTWILERRLLRHFGNRSYAIYIFQMMILIPINQLYLSRWKVAGASVSGAVYAFGIAVLLILLLAEISWHCYEKQFLKLKRFFPREELRVEPIAQTEPSETVS